MYTNATIVTLEPTTDGSDAIQSVRSATFEEAFGEFSEARGRGRAKRQAKKLDRQKNKAERKVAKQTTKQSKIKARQETKQLRVGGRQEARLSRRSTRKQSRQDMRNEQQDNRMSRRGRRLDMKQERSEAKQIRKDTKVQGEEGREDFKTTAQNERDMQSAEAQAYQDSLQPEDTSTDSENMDTTTNEQGYDQTAPEEAGYDQSADEQSYDQSEDNSDYDESYPTDESNYSEDDYSEDEYADESGYEGGDEETESFDGVELDSNFHEIEGDKKVHPKLQEIMDKIEWNKECIALLEKKLKVSNNKPEVAKHLAKRRQRLSELEAKVKGYSSFDDAYSGANGVPSAEHISKVKAKRNEEINLAFQRALAKKKLAKKQRIIEKQAKLAKSPKNGGDSTPVDLELNPQFSPKRIVVPPSSSADGLESDDYYQDEDGQYDSQLDVFLGADGAGTPPYEFSSLDGTDTSTKSNISIGGVAIGLGLGLLAIWGIRKYKLLK